MNKSYDISRRNDEFKVYYKELSSYNSTSRLGTHLIENTRIWNGKNELAQVAQKRPIRDYREDVREKECSQYRSNYRPSILDNAIKSR